ncbi:UMF1 family MFS transporter [Polaribacter sp. Hel1_33_96]|uniref:MFS transporter n=1 Tax=Polaribacter sp. Hel1_33_96 TaxID=1336805 RepID=UPI000C70E2FE|nr:MFS transporter [Polaribacter sp. Hel1_33_96]PKV64548.1 UMF1 family MFS transporter [Polaribacter sp. Hel1_33_96]
MLKIGDKKLINAWAFYDWANSVYSLVISSAVFPIYYAGLTTSKFFANADGEIEFLGTLWNPTSLYNYALAFSFLVVAFISPMLSGIADYAGNKKKFLKGFCLLGSLSVMSLFFFTGKETLWVGIVFTILASIGFWGSIVFYNAYLPEVANPEQQDNVSAKGFMLGYSGSIILLLICLVLIETEVFGFYDKQFGSQLSFVLVGIWWLGFAQITYAKLPKEEKTTLPKDNYFTKGLKEIQKVSKELFAYRELKIFLISFFLLSIGVQTIILMAGIFGTILGLETLNLLATILLVQFVGILGAFLFSRLSNKIGNIKTIKIAIAIWGLVCFIGFNLTKETPHIEMYFYILGGLIGLVMGAIQSLARSTYSKLLPETEDTASYFSFYDVTEKIALVVGMVTFGFLNSIFTIQSSVLALAVFFLASFIVLSIFKKTKHVQ